MSKFGELTPKAFYVKYEGKRSDYEDMAERISNMTLPYIMMRDGSTSNTRYSDAIAQSYCGRLVQTLKSKMGMSLLPPSTSSFRLAPNNAALMELTEGNPDFIAEIFAQLSSVTAQINAEIEAQQIRDSMFEMLVQLIVIGSVVIEKINGDGLMIHTLRNFTVDVDNRGEARAICVLEKKKDLPEGIVPDKIKDEYNLYTLLERNNEDGKWYQTQSIEDDIIGEEVKYTDRTLPFQYVGWTFTSGDSYHRPYAEDYIDDMEQFNTLSNLLTKGSIIASKSLILVDQKGNRTKLSDVTDSENGAVINGRADDITAFQLQKNFDFQVPMERLADIGKNLASAFLMNESVTRDAERVTAQEIRFMAQELESSSLSGVYSKLSKKVSKRIVEWIMDEIGVKFNEVSVNIITGLDALGRSQEAQKLDSLVQRMAAMNLSHWLNEADLIQRYASFEGIDTTNLIKTPTQVADEQKEAANAASMQQGSEAMMASAGQAVGGSVVPQQ